VFRHHGNDRLPRADILPASRTQTLSGSCECVLEITAVSG
jgi:hypothetical protein